VERVAVATLPTEWGEFRIAGYRSLVSDEEFVALFKGEMRRDTPTLVRIHSQCLTGDVFGSTKCDCGAQLHQTMQMIEREGRGAIVYQQQEGRGIGLMAKLQAYELQDQGRDTVQANEELGFKADHRGFQLPAEILAALKLKAVRLLSNNPDKVAALEAAGIKVTERVPCEVEPNAESERYLNTKKEKLGHLFSKR